MDGRRDSWMDGWMVVGGYGPIKSSAWELRMADVEVHQICMYQLMVQYKAPGNVSVYYIVVASLNLNLANCMSLMGNIQLPAHQRRG